MADFGFEWSGFESGPSEGDSEFDFCEFLEKKFLLQGIFPFVYTPLGKSFKRISVTGLWIKSHGAQIALFIGRAIEHLPMCQGYCIPYTSVEATTTMKGRDG